MLASQKARRRAGWSSTYWYEQPTLARKFGDEYGDRD
jgi:hypothetical protein